MKFLSKTTCLLLMIVTVFSCDEVDELTDIEVNDDFDATISVDITEDSEGQPVDFEESLTIDIATNEEIQDNLDLIEDVSITSFTYQFMNYEGPDGGTLSDVSITIGNTSIAIDDVDVDAASSAGTEYTIEDTSLLEAIENALENDPKVTVVFAATVSSSPVSFDVDAFVDATVTIDVL